MAPRCLLPGEVAPKQLAAHGVGGEPQARCGGGHVHGCVVSTGSDPGCAASGGGEVVAASGVLAGEEIVELLRADLARQAKLGGARPGPAPRRFASAQVVVGGVMGDLAQGIVRIDEHRQVGHHALLLAGKRRSTRRRLEQVAPPPASLYEPGTGGHSSPEASRLALPKTP